jgi:hypothetical protein
VIKLKAPLLWDGHVIPEGKNIGLPAELEKRIVSAGNAEYANPAEESIPEKTNQPDILDLVKADLEKRIEALGLDLPDGLSVDEVREAVEKAERELENGVPTGGAAANDPEFSLGRVRGTK